jgi:hypothetical protein
MTLEEFLMEQQVRLINFAKFWKSNECPMELEPGEWDEQFQIFNDD